MVRLSGSSLVLCESGRRETAATLAVGTRVLALSEHLARGTLSISTVSSIADSSPRANFRITLASGREFVLPREGRLATANGWAPVSRIDPNARVAMTRALPEPPRAVRWPDYKLILLGHLIGDGSFLCGSPMRYTTSSEENSKAISEAARAIGCEVKRYAGRRTWHQLLLSGNGNRWQPAAANLFLRDLGIFGQRSHQKRLPAALFELDNACLALFLRHLYATDGTFCVRTGKGGHGLSYSTNSEGLAMDLLAMLLRFGVVARRTVAAQGRYRPMHLVQVSGRDSQLRFLDRVGVFGPKVPGAIALRAAITGTAASTNVDTVPPEFFDRVEDLVRTGSEELKRLRIGLRRNPKRPGNRLYTSRAKLAECGELLGDDLTIARANSDIFWDRVVEIAKEVAPQPTVELTLDPPGSGVLVDGILVGETPREYLAACPRTPAARGSVARDREATAPRRNRRARRVARARA